MNGFLRLLLAMCLSLTMVRCASQPTEESGQEPSPSVTGNSEQDFSGIDDSGQDQQTSQVGANSDQAIEDELNQSEAAAPPVQEQAQEEPVTEPPAPEIAAAPEEVVTPAPDIAAPAPEGEAPVDEFAEFDNEKASPPAAQNQVQAEPPVAIEPPPPETIPPSVDLGGTPVPLVESTPEPVPTETAPPVATAQLVNIKNIKYKLNDNGGTVVVEADGPMTFQTRTNAETGQFIIEIPGAKLPQKLKRPFNTKDMKGGIGSIDSYQNKGSSTARIVVQLRQGASEPVVQAEGNSLLIVEAGTSSAATVSSQAKAEMETGTPADSGEAPIDDGSTTQSKIMSSQSLEEFVSENMQFYGKKFSLETTEMDVREVFKLIAEESGINMVLSDEVKGTVSLKLRQVPWDQAMVVIMKAKKLGYTRAGNVLRIAPMNDIKAEEDESIRLSNVKKAQNPLRVRLVPVSYAKIDDLVGQVKPFLSDRGKVVGDNRTSSLVISDIEENMDRVLKLVTSIDVPPLQVLIEGKVIEATDNFERQIGINWQAFGRPSVLGSNGVRDIRGKTDLSSNPGLGPATLAINFNMGTLDVLGDLSAQLGLFEKQDLVKVLSAPRIMTLHNEAAEINQTTEIPLISETTTTAGPTRSVTFKPVKLRLSVIPQITNDAAIIMTVDVNRDFMGTISDATTGARPVYSRAAKTKVMVKNGQTAVIGGIYQSDDQQGETKIPWLGDVPILGWLFKNKNWKKDKSELLIFLTPRIIGQADSQSIPSEEGGNL